MSPHVNWDFSGAWTIMQSRSYIIPSINSSYLPDILPVKA